jgi:hypothetical protein
VASTTAATYAAQLPPSMAMSAPPGRSSYSEYLFDETAGVRHDTACWPL